MNFMCRNFISMRNHTNRHEGNDINFITFIQRTAWMYIYFNVNTYNQKTIDNDNKVL